MNKIQFWSPRVGNFQFALLTLGRFNEFTPEDHDEPEYITWYLHFLFWQLTYTREVDSHE